MKKSRTHGLKLSLLLFSLSAASCSQTDGVPSDLADTTGRYDLSGKSYLGSNGECLKFVDNEIAEYLNGDDFRAGSYTWEPENIWMNMYLQVPGNQLPGFETVTAQWKKTRSGGLEVELVLGGNRTIRMKAAACSTEREINVEPGEIEPVSEVRHRLLGENLGGYTEGSVEGPFSATSNSEWNDIYLSRMNNSFGSSRVPQFGVDFSKEFIWGYQLVSGHVTSSPRLLSVVVEGNKLVVALEQTSLGSGCYSLPAYSAPSIVLALPIKYAGRVETSIRNKIQDCQ
jgi:hypothetical protein